jgi:hypothetical protein
VNGQILDDLQIGRGWIHHAKALVTGQMFTSVAAEHLSAELSQLAP